MKNIKKRYAVKFIFIIYGGKHIEYNQEKCTEKKIGEKIEKKLRDKMDFWLNTLNMIRKNAEREKNCTINATRSTL